MHMYEEVHKTPLEMSQIHSLRNRAPPLNRPGTGRNRNRSSTGNDHSLRKHQRESSVANTRSSWVKAMASPRMGVGSGMASGGGSGRGGFDFIAEESVERGETPNESTMNQPSKEQLLREHQEYWEQLVRMEDEMEGLKQQNVLLVQNNTNLKEDCKRAK